MVGGLAIADANGVIVACSALEDVGETVELGSLFPQADASIQVVRVGSPQTGRDWASRTPVASTPMAGGQTASPQFVPVVVPISNSHTTYWLVAALNPDLFINQATHKLDAKNSHVIWLRYDGLLLWVSDTDNMVALVNQSRALGSRLPDKEFGQAPQTLSDGSEVLNAYRASSRYPTAVAVYLDKQEVLAPWRGTTLEQLAVLGPALLLLLAGWTLYTRRVHQANLREAQAAEERELAARVFDSSSDAILITTPDARIVSVKAAFSDLTGYSVSEAVGQNPRILNSGAHDKAFYAAMWIELQAHGRWKGHITNQRKGGGLFEANLTINAIRDASGAVHHYAGVIEDITEARRAHERLLLAGSVFDHAHEAIMITDPVFGGLAVSLIFGTFASTALTLVVIPLMYYLWQRKLATRQ